MGGEAHLGSVKDSEEKAARVKSNQMNPNHVGLWVIEAISSIYANLALNGAFLDGFLISQRF